MQCPICGAPAKDLIENAEGLSVDCPRCGTYQVTDPCLNGLLRLDPEERKQALEGARRSAAPGELATISAIPHRPWWQRLWHRQ